MKAFRIIKRVSIIFVLVIVIFVSSITFSYNRAKAVVPLAIGAGIVACVSAFMAAAGVQLTPSNGQPIDEQGWVDFWDNVASSFSYDGKSLVDWNNEKDAWSAIVGRDNVTKYITISSGFAEWLNEFKNWFVGENNISSTPVTMGSSPYFLDKTGKKVPYVIYNGRPDAFTLGEYNNSQGIFSVDPSSTPIGILYSFNLDNINYSIFLDSTSTSGWPDGRARSVFSIYQASTRISNVGTTYYYGANGTNKLLLLYNGSELKFFLYNHKYNTTNVLSGSLLGSINVSNIDNASISVDGVLTDGYSDFENALDEALNDAGTGSQANVGINVGELDIPQPWTSDRIATGINASAGAGTLTGELVGGYTNNKEAEDELDGEYAPSDSFVGSNIIVVDGLEDFFPFCIPFDLIEIIRKFDVEPEAPVIHWNMSFANLYTDQELVLDFSPWETAALVFRICCLIGFSIFLILKTRDIIRG